MQALDTKSDQLTRRRRTLPEATEADRVAAEYADVDGGVVELETQLSDLGREQRKADADVEQVRTRRARTQDRLDRGQVSSPKDLENLQNELESLAKRQSDLEDVELEIMERLEDAQKRHTDLTQRRTDLVGGVAEAERTRDARYAEIDAELEQLRSQRAEMAREIPEDLATLYERLRAQHAGVGAAALRQRRCEGCNIELDAAELNRISTSAPEVVHRCENCSRILVRTSESGV